MATNGSGRVPSAWNNNYGLFFEWSAERNIAGNYSDITATVYADLLGYATISVGARSDSTLSIAGQQESINAPAVSKLSNGNARIRLGSINKRVNHRNDGTLPNVVLSANWPIRATISGVYRSNISGSFSTGEITRIPRASEILSSVDFTLENDLKVNLKRYSEDFKHDILLKINGSNFKTITNVDTSTTITFTETEINNLYNQSVNVSELSTELVVTTKQNSTTIGTTNKKGVMLVDGIKNAPTFSEFEFKPDSNTTSATGWSAYINKDNELSVLSQSKYTIKPGVASGKNHATIKHWEVSLNNRVYTSTVAEFTLPNPIMYNDNLIVTAVDSRGFKTSVSKRIIGQQYEGIKFNKLDIKRRAHPNQSQVNFDISGVIFKNSKVNNWLKSVSYKSVDVSTGVSSTYSITSNFTVNQNGVFTANFNRSGFDATKAYNIEFEITDCFSTEKIIIPIQKEVPVVSITKKEFKFFGLTFFEWVDE